MNSGLYIHIPFCIQKCSYCDFFSVKAGQFNNILGCKGISPFARRLVTDIHIQAKKYGIEEWDSVYIGGGTPSLLSPDDIYFISSQILKDQKNPPKEFSIEINPEDLSRDFLSAAVKGGINRISVGVQSLSDEVLKACNRRGCRQKTFFALELLRQEKNILLSCDLIAGLKNQTSGIIKDDIETLLKFIPEHFSLYALCSNTKISSEKDDEIAALWLYGKDILEKNSYTKYEVSNFSYKNSYKSIHNEKYWRLQNYIGIGPGAFSSIFFDRTENLPAHAIRFSAIKNIHKWLSCENRDEVYEYETIDEKEFIEETFMMGLRLKDGLDRKFFKLRFGKDISAFIEKIMFKYRDYAVLTDEKFYLTDKGFLYLNLFLQDIFQQIDSLFV